MELLCKVKWDDGGQIKLQPEVEVRGASEGRNGIGPIKHHCNTVPLAIISIVKWIDVGLPFHRRVAQSRLYVWLTGDCGWLTIVYEVAPLGRKRWSTTGWAIRRLLAGVTFSIKLARIFCTSPPPPPFCPTYSRQLNPISKVPTR